MIGKRDFYNNNSFVAQCKINNHAALTELNNYYLDYEE